MNNTVESLVSALRRAGMKISSAESCTGGLIAKKITDVAGCSEVFAGGVVSYANEVKANVLGVSWETLSSVGAVSRETALQMANGVRKICKTDIGISTTGIAGPGGGTPEKPVGLVFIGISSEKSSRVLELRADPSLSRAEIREKAADAAISLAFEGIG